MTNTVESMTMLEKFGEKLFRLRDYTPIPVGIIAILYATPVVNTIIIGFVLAVCGELFRIYGVAFIGTISRTRSYSNGALIQSGPFSLMRNPLYFGNLLLVFGFSMMSGVWWISVMALAFFYAQYIPIVAWEEMKLRKIFGTDYIQYCERVKARWFPNISCLVRLTWLVQPDSWKPALKSEKRTFIAILIVVVVIFGLFLANARSEASFLPLANLLFSGK